MCNTTLEPSISFRWGSKLLTLISMKCNSKSMKYKTKRAAFCILHSIRRIMFWWCHILWIVFHTKNLNFPHMTRQPLINKSLRKIMHFSSIFTFWTAHGNWFSQMQDSINCSTPFPCNDVTDLTVPLHFSNPVYWLKSMYAGICSPYWGRLDSQSGWSQAQGGSSLT